MNKKLRYLTQKLEKVNLLESWAEKYKPVKYEITKFNDDEKNLKWLTQFHHGCLLFSLLNGNFFELRSEGVFDFNLNFSHHIGRARSNMQIIVGVVHEYKAILLWYLLTKINVLGAGNMRCMHDMIHEMLNSTSKNKICELAKKLATIIWGYEERFAVKYKKGQKLDFAYQGWKILGKTAKIIEGTQNPEYLSIKLKYFERLPKFSAFCFGDHWLTFLGCDGMNMFFIDSKRSKKFRRLTKTFVAMKATAVFIKGEENMEKNFSEDDFSNMPDDSDFYSSVAFINSLLPDMSDADAGDTPEFVRRIQSTVDMDDFSSHDNSDIETDYSKIDFTHFEEYDLEFLKELAEKSKSHVVGRLEVLGNFSEAEKIKNFSADEWFKWSKKEKERIEALEEAVRKKRDSEQ